MPTSSTRATRRWRCESKFDDSTWRSRSVPVSPPYAGKPRLLIARQTDRLIVVVQLDDAGCRHEAPPRLERVVHTVAVVVPPFLVIAARIGAHQHATRFQRRMELGQYARQFLTGNVLERGVREHAVEPLVRQREREEILLPHLAPAVRARHGREPRRSFDADCGMAELVERREIAARSTA